ncbi:UNVERIFIED_CONTAM: hypothetical protein Sradi_0647900 [Sesamum radiatum]|uniref:SWIM-type domain-containing protein n=1 Tax=Sesamum radiatum TaxID=300843 RepID=A0AAW2VKX6_SESRA
MSMLTQDLSSLPVVTEAMGGFGLDENYSASSSYATPSNYAGPSDNAGPSSYVGQSNYAGPSSNAGTSAYNEEDDDPEDDSLLYNESSDSEPDEVEEEDQMPANHENDDEVSIDIMMDVFGNNADAPTTPVDGNFDLNMPTGSVPPYNLYPVPAFFRTTHPEIPADSIDVPTGNWGHFYDSNTGELALGMVFQEQGPLESKCTRFLGPTCKTRIQSGRKQSKIVEGLLQMGCRDWVQLDAQGIFKSNMRLFKITRLFEARQAEAIHHIVQKFDYNQQSASVITLSTTGQGSRTYVVKLRQQMCSCGKWATHGIPCSHAIQASRHFGMNASNFIPQYFSTRAYKKTYLGRFEPVYGEEYWDPVHFELVHNPTKRTRRGPGRDVTTRIRNEMDQPQRRARQQYQAHQT